MGYYGASVYRGDYYGQGDFYRTPMAGDPGFFDFLGGLASKVLPVAAPIVGGMFGGPVGAAVGGFAGGMLGKVLGPGPPAPSGGILAGGAPPIWSATAPGTGSTIAMIPTSPFAQTYAMQQSRGMGLAGPTPMPGGSKMAGFSIGGPKGLVYNGGKTVRDESGHGHHFHDGKHRGPTHTAFRRVDSWEVKDSRRMNPLNPHALRRSLRRARGFTKLVSKTLRFTKPGHHVKGFKGKGKR